MDSYENASFERARLQPRRKNGFCRAALAAEEDRPQSLKRPFGAAEAAPFQIRSLNVIDLRRTTLAFRTEKPAQLETRNWKLETIPLSLVSLAL
jgi:hypothetical protein